MPAGPRPASRPGAGPGRGRPRARSTARTSPPTRRTAPPQPDRTAGPQGQSETRPQTAGRRRSSLTTRAIALAVVFLILTISYASSLRIYFAQSAQIATTQQQITDSQNRISDLQTDLARWRDPDYVKAQARARLGWVMPGEKGFTVVGQDGQPLGGGAQIASAQPPVTTEPAWWTRMWGSVEAADKPAPKPTTPTKPPAITATTKPGSLVPPSATPSAGTSPGASPTAAPSTPR
jgi:cell division protein FtsB